MFRGRHFDQSVILLCVRWVSGLQPEPSRFEGDDG
jgi:transposase-like protein